MEQKRQKKQKNDQWRLLIIFSFSPYLSLSYYLSLSLSHRHTNTHTQTLSLFFFFLSFYLSFFLSLVQKLINFNFAINLSILNFFRNILAQALLELHKKENVTEAPSNCNTSGALWQTGKRLFEYIRNQVTILVVSIG